ncbi:MAG: protein TonB [Pseudohongiellaceae bacterium]|jgi:protein TonB
MYLVNLQHALYRFTSAMIGASLITLALLLFMHQLIKVDVPIISKITAPIQISIMAPDPIIEEIRHIKPIQPIQPVDPPENTFDPTPTAVNTIAYAVDTPVFEGPQKGAFDNSATSSAVSMMQLAPNYPARARSKGIEGYVDLVFDLTATGQTLNIRILKSEPSGYFENTSIRALKKWKYQPAMEEGKAIAMFNMTTRINYNLDK